MKLDYSKYSTDKDTGHSYMETYENLFSRYDNTPVSLLEIGVFAGGSLKMWKDFFAEDSLIHGVDLYPNYSNSADYHENVKDAILYEGNATTIQLKEKFDIIIDDGSHIFEDVLLAMKNLWWNLKAGGIYIVEDVAADGSFGWVHNEWNEQMQSRLGLEYELVNLLHERPTPDNVLLVFRKEN